MSRLLWTVACLTAIGCGGTSTDPDLIPASGLVVIDEKPLADATIEFTPVEGSSGIGGVGRSGSDGRYTITNHRNSPGVPPGQYKVTVVKWVKKDGSVLGEEETPIDTPDLKLQVPIVYTEVETTPLTVTVSREEGIPDLKLSSKAKAPRKR